MKTDLLFTFFVFVFGFLLYVASALLLLHQGSVGCRCVLCVTCCVRFEVCFITMCNKLEFEALCSVP